MGTKYFNTQPSLEGLPSNVPRHWHQDLFEAFLVIITVRRSVLPHKDFGCVACPCPQAFCGGPRVATLSLDARSDQCPETANRQGTSELTALQSSSFLEEHWKPLRPEAHEPRQTQDPSRIFILADLIYALPRQREIRAIYS
ncbi:hypothetical protein DPX16_1124 [Anabarilius grahami]|uniref:Uncharacterized protein n=1 Tax=Anabarilius grahami TaxID=495550 RepID=A0A3N0YWZ5_ANAGA|nr:hypothetical protein DPX16_1124 [Anabarilius grahami]